MATQLSKPAPAEAPYRLTAKMFEEREELEERRKKIGREAAALKKQVDDIDAVFALYVESNAKGKTRRVETCGHELSIEQKPKSVGWKALFVKLLGKERAEQAEAEVGTRDQLVIRKL